MADLYGKYACTYCQEEISGPRVKCVDCKDFDLCLQCFSAGAEIGSHKNDHSYQFKDSGCMEICIGKNGWTTREELLLLDSIENFGFGNWDDISKHIKTRTPEEAKDEYISQFIEGTIGRLTWSAVGPRPNLVDETIQDSGPLSPDMSSRIPPLDVTEDESILLGYKPHRDDYDEEFDNKAEETLMYPSFINISEDDELDTALKLTHVDMYTQVLRERARRKRVVRDFQLVSQFFSSSRRERGNNKKKLSKEEREFQDRMRIFTQFHTAKEHEQFLQGLRKERELKIRISELARYRRNGLTRREECVHFEQERLQHEEWKEKRSGSSGSIPSPPSMGKRKRERNENLFSIERKSTHRSSTYILECGWEGTDSGGENQSPSEIASLPAGNLLSPYEIQLCTSYNMKPTHYFAVKSGLLRGFLRNEGNKEPPSSMTATEIHILNYLKSCGWIASS